MTNQLTPKEAFQKNEDRTKEFRGIVDSVAFREAVHNAIAYFVINSNPTTDELSGVRRFLDVLINLGEKDEPLVNTGFQSLSSIEAKLRQKQPNK